MGSAGDSIRAMGHQYARKVSAIRGDCADAAGQISSATENVDSNWKGSSGDGMHQALNGIAAKLKSIQGALASLEGLIRSEANSAAAEVDAYEQLMAAKSLKAPDSDLSASCSAASEVAKEAITDNKPDLWDGLKNFAGKMGDLFG